MMAHASSEFLDVLIAMPRTGTLQLTLMMELAFREFREFPAARIAMPRTLTSQLTSMMAPAFLISMVVPIVQQLITTFQPIEMMVLVFIEFPDVQIAMPRTLTPQLILKTAPVF